MSESKHCRNCNNLLTGNEQRGDVCNECLDAEADDDPGVVDTVSGREVVQAPPAAQVPRLRRTPKGTSQ